MFSPEHTQTGRAEHHRTMPGGGDHRTMPGGGHHRTMPGGGHYRTMPGSGHHRNMPGGGDTTEPCQVVGTPLSTFPDNGLST